MNQLCAEAGTLCDTRQALPALLLSLVLHALVFAVWPHLEVIQSRPVIVTGELVAPPAEASPPPLPLPQPEPLPSVQEVPAPRKAPAEPPVASPKPAVDTGVALPLLAEKSDAPGDQENDYVVQEAPPLVPGDQLPFGSKPGETPLEQYTPGAVSSGEGESTGVNNLEDPVDRNVLAEYGDSLRARASQFGSYPALAQKRGWQGGVKVMVRYARSGEAYQITVKETSGHKVLDEQALKMVKQACQDFPLPPPLVSKAFSVVVPIDFKLK